MPERAILAAAQVVPVGEVMTLTQRFVVLDAPALNVREVSTT
jgi:hypothetical protein